ncbi:unnamed protein product [Victoria cruziana]
MRMTMVKLVISILLFSCAAAQQLTNEYIGSRCSNTSNYTAGSTFERNMKVVLASLTTDALPSGFSNKTAGLSPNEVYGLAQCRGDVTGNGCAECLDNAAVDVVRRCPYSIDAIVWYEQCQLRYSNANFFGVLDVKDVTSWYYSKEVKDPLIFGQKLKTLLNSLGSQATTSASLFAAGSMVYEESEMIYGLTQCTMDTSVVDCKSCLGATIEVMLKYVGAKVGAELVSATCRVRFGLAPFYATPPSATPPPPSTSSPPPPPPSISPPPPPPPPRSSSHPPPPPPLRTDSANHSTATSVAMNTVITFALMSTYWLLMAPS